MRKYSVGSGMFVSPGADPVTYDSRANHVGDELVVFAVPDPNDRARTAAPVDFLNDVAAARTRAGLHLARRPVGQSSRTTSASFAWFRPATSRRPILAKISRRCRQLPFLAQSSGEHFDFRAHATSIVGEAAKAQAHGRSC